MTAIALCIVFLMAGFALVRPTKVHIITGSVIGAVLVFLIGRAMKQ